MLYYFILIECCINVLKLVGIEIIFFIEANLVMVIRPMLITPLLLNSACTASRPLLFLTLPLHMNRLGADEIWRGYRQDSWSEMTKETMHYDIILSYKTRQGCNFPKVVCVWGLAGNQSARRKWWGMTFVAIFLLFLPFIC